MDGLLTGLGIARLIVETITSKPKEMIATLIIVAAIMASKQQPMRPPHAELPKVPPTVFPQDGKLHHELGW